ncbi:MAG: RDD family protein [Rhodobacteraceae bacterium]|nr:MAG: RDD family protein [Paracoccaceae bacterium]
MFDVSSHGGLPHPVHDARFYEGVPLRRLIAFAIDAVAATAAGVVVALAFGLLTLGIGFAAWAPAMAATAFLYRALPLGRWSATPGMLAVGVEMRRLDGGRFGPAEALAHTAGFMVAFFFVLPQIVSVVLMATGPLGRGLHDMAIGSAAINRPA